MAKKHATRTAAVDQQDNERWLDIAGYEGFYQVSDRGRVKSLPRTVPMKDGRTYRVGVKILKPAWTGFYHHVILSKGGKEETKLVHLLVLNAFIGPCPEGMVCRHLDGNSRNNVLTNLCWGTPKENGEDKVRHKEGRVKKGRHPWCLRGKTEEILKLKAAGESAGKIAKRYGVTTPAIYWILRRERNRLKE